MAGGSLGPNELILPTATSDPTGSEGSMYLKTDSKAVRVKTSDGWKTVYAPSGGDDYIDDVLLYLRGGSTSAEIEDASYSITSQGASTSTTPGKPFSAAPSTSWYQLNTSTTSNYINIGSSTASHFSPANYTNFTIEFWWMPYGTNGSYGHFYWVGGQGNEGIIKYGGASSSGGGTAYGMYWYTNNTVIQTGGSGTHSQGTWYWIVFEKEGSTNSLWVDGTRVAQNTNSWVTQNETGDFKLGYSSPTGEYNAHFFDELRITAAARYNGAASINVQSAAWPTY